MKTVNVGCTRIASNAIAELVQTVLYSARTVTRNGLVTSTATSSSLSGVKQSEKVNMKNVFA